HLQHALPFHLDDAARLERETGNVLYERVGGRGDVDPPGVAVGLHAAGRIDGVAPEVVLEFLDANDPGDDGTRVDADAHLEIGDAFAAPGFGPFFDEPLHGQCGPDGIRGRRCADPLDPRAGHVRIADRLDLFQPILAHDLIE